MNFLTIKEIKKELRNYFNDNDFNSWFNIVKDILANKEFQKRRLFKHHKKSVWEHSIEVSFRAYKYAKKFNANKRVCAIGGLLHDFYPYAWLYSKELDDYDSSYLKRLKLKEPLLKKHGFTHAKEAHDNYLKFFSQYKNEKISDCIIKHMFPLNIKLPKYRESWIVTFSDKVVSLSDTGYVVKAILFNKEGSERCG